MALSLTESRHCENNATHKSDIKHSLRSEQEAAEQQAREEFYWSLWDEWIRLDRNRREYAPQSTSDELHPLFVEAVAENTLSGVFD